MRLTTVVQVQIGFPLLSDAVQLFQVVFVGPEWGVHYIFCWQMSEMTGALMRVGFICSLSRQLYCELLYHPTPLPHCLPCPFWRVHINLPHFYKRWRNNSHKQMQPSRKSFSMHTDAFSVTTTYQPAHVLFQVQDKRTNKLKLSLLEDSTLPQNIREECEEVSGLYEFLSGKSPQEIEVDEGTLKFKVVHIRKERWYSLDLQDQQAPEMMEEEGHSSSEVQKLQLQIRELREEISRLQALNNNYKFQQPQIPQATVPLQISQPITYEKVSKLLQLTPNFACKGANSHYAVADRLVTKCTDGQSLLIFEERIKEERVHFSITVDSELTNNWIIFGAITEQYREDDWCYFEQNCIAFSGSMGIIYNGLDVIDLNILLRVGSCIRLQIDPHSQVAEWTIDGVLVSRHKMRVNIELGLYPYLMLAHAGDRVLLGSE